MTKVMTWLLVLAAVLFALLLFTNAVVTEPFANPAPSDAAPSGVPPACKNYGFSLPPEAGEDSKKRLYTKSGCDALGGTLSSRMTCYIEGGTDWSSQCGTLDYKTPAPNECYVNGDRTSIPPGKPSGKKSLWFDATGKLRDYTKEECAKLGGTLDGQGSCNLNSVNLDWACASLNYQPAPAPTPASAPGSAPSDAAPSGVPPECKNYGWSAGHGPGQGMRWYTRSACDKVGGNYSDGMGNCKILKDPKGQASTNNILKGFNALCKGLGMDTPAPDECYINKDRTSVAPGSPCGIIPDRPELTNKLRTYTRDECAKLGGKSGEAFPPGSTTQFFCALNDFDNPAVPQDKKEYLDFTTMCAPLNSQPAAPVFSPTVSAALAPGTPSAGISCPACASCPPAPPAQCPPSAPCPACATCPTCAPPTICPDPPDCPKYDKKK